MNKVDPIPAGFHTITPYLISRDARKALEFLKAGLGAEVLSSHESPTGRIVNAELRIGNSMVMMGEEQPGASDRAKAMLYLYVKDCDALHEQAVQAGAKKIMPPTDMFYGDRAGAVEDADGNQWWIATRKENLSAEELTRRTAQAGK